jgi:hypothetical protein
MLGRAQISMVGTLLSPPGRGTNCVKNRNGGADTTPINPWACAAALIAHDKNMTFAGESRDESECRWRLFCRQAADATII